MKKEETFFGKQLKKFLYEKNITQTELANKLGINSSMISQWVRGSGNPRLSSVRKIAAVLGIPINYLIEESAVKNNGSLNENTNSSDVNINLIMKLVDEKMKRFELEIDYLKEKIKNLEKK